MWTVRKVERPARRGEYIMITDAHANLGKYKNGDVLKVTGEIDSYVLCKGIDHIIFHDEYVVLENWMGGE